MSQNKGLEFTCPKCGADKLGYKKYVQCITPVSQQEDGHVEYGQSIIDEDDSLATLSGFACQLCGTLIEHCGYRLETEKELIDYLRMEPFDRLHQQQEYHEFVDAQISALEEKQKEQGVTLTSILKNDDK